MNNVTHKITYLEMWIYFLFFNSEHSQVHMSACFFILFFSSPGRMSGELLSYPRRRRGRRRGRGRARVQKL